MSDYMPEKDGVVTLQVVKILSSHVEDAIRFYVREKFKTDPKFPITVVGPNEYGGYKAYFKEKV